MLRNCIARQINEVESLQAMFYGQDEMTLWNHCEYESLKQLVSGKIKNNKSDEVPQVAFQLQVPLSKPYPESAPPLVIQIKLPSFYPSSDSAQVRVCLDLLTPIQEKVLRDAASAFVVSKLGQECILDLVQFAKDWVYDNSPPPPPTPKSVENSPVQTTSGSLQTTPAVAAATTVPTACATSGSTNPVTLTQKSSKLLPKSKPPPPVKEYEFRRILVWFSTIAPDRSRTVAEWAKQLGLSGVSRLGSPALLVVEGQKEDVDEYVSSLRSFRWKKMDIVWEDRHKSTNINSCRKFTSFQETMAPIPELQVMFKKAGLEEMFKEGLKIRG